MSNVSVVRWVNPDGEVECVTEDGARKFVPCLACAEDFEWYEVTPSGIPDYGRVWEYWPSEACMHLARFDE